MALGRPLDRQQALAAAEALFPSDDEQVASTGRLAETAIRLLGDTVPEAILVARFRQIADRRAPHRVTSLPDVRQTLERIASLGIPMAVLCNGWSRIARREAGCAGFTGPVLTSEDIGIEKPARGAFEKLVELLNVPAECIWYVGSDPLRDVDGALQAGMTTVWFNPRGSAYPPHLEPPTLTIRSLDDLLPPLCEQYTRSLLSLRHLLRTALEWRDGHYLPPTETW